MRILVKEVIHKKDLKKFINFPYHLYKGHNCFVPPLRFDEENTLRKDKNPAFDYCEAKYWLAYKDKKVVGRIAGIINRSYIEKWQNKYMRFGWFDFEDNEEINISIYLNTLPLSFFSSIRLRRSRLGPKKRTTFNNLTHQ